MEQYAKKSTDCKWHAEQWQTLWLLFKPVWLQFNYPQYTQKCRYTKKNTHICLHACTDYQSGAWWTPALIPPSCSLAGGWEACQACLTSRRMPVVRPHTDKAAAKPHKEIVNECTGLCSASLHTQRHAHTHHVVYFIWLIPTYTYEAQCRQVAIRALFIGKCSTLRL